MDVDALRRDRPERPGQSLGAVGRASRFACALQTGTPAELWCLPAADLALAKRLALLGAEGLGGFDAGWGEDERGAFLLRRLPSRTIDALGKGERLDGLTAIGKTRDLARALAACERAAIFPGPLRTAEIALGSAGRAEAWALAEAFVRARLGDVEGAAGVTAPSPRWTPPEQAAGAPWDNAANRYVLGLVAYRLVAGAHPFSGVGLRDAMRAQEKAPPPFDEAIAAALRPGIQSLVLAMIDPDPARRPASAADVVRRCEEILESEVPLGRASSSARAADPRDARRALPLHADPAPRRAPAAGVKAARPFARGGPARLLGALAPIVAGLAVAAAALVASGKEEPAARPAPARALSRDPLTTTTAATCAPCHARQVAEWQRSVMAHAVKSPLFGALESLVEEQVGRDAECPNGAGVLRKRGGDVCRDARTGFTLTGAGGEHWCVNCHSASDNLGSSMPAWSAVSSSAARRPVRDLLSKQAMEGISCAVCHTTVGPVHPGGRGYQGNPSWVSPESGAVFTMRPEDARGVFGIANSGYLLDERSFLTTRLGAGARAGDPIVHRATPDDTKAYLATSQFCGACHDVRLFGSDTLGAREKGEHFKRLRNAYSEWKTWADGERAAGRRAASCQDCHMSLYPGVCVADAKGPSGASGASGAGGARDGCPPGTHFEARAPGEKARGMVAASSSEATAVTSHYFTGVERPLSDEFPERWATDTTLDANGVPLGLEVRREQLLRHTFRFELTAPSRAGGALEIPIEIQNVGAGHRVPAGFSQEREIWVELTVKDARGGVVYEVGKVPNDEADLRDKVFVRTSTRDDQVDFKGRPLGVFGADVVDGPDVGQWSPNPSLGGTLFRGKGLINFQNGFLRCVRCVGVVDARGRCQPGPGQGATRADRFADGQYDIDTGECRSNLEGLNALFETYFPVGALDADRGVAKAPDAIIDTRSAPPNVTIKYVYELDAAGHPAPFTVEARLRFRPFPPFLLRAFADYEARKAAEGARPSGAQLTRAMLRKNEIIDLAEASETVD
jgi:hypothetical protein